MKLKNILFSSTKKVTTSSNTGNALTVSKFIGKETSSNKASRDSKIFCNSELILIVPNFIYTIIMIVKKRRLKEEFYFELINEERKLLENDYDMTTVEKILSMYSNVIE